jgi:Mn-dependent DtxR family transcriptional regulator
MLGVRRTSVTEVAGKLQAAGIISYSRGVIRIVDRAALESASCECYSTLIDHTRKIAY